MFGKKPVHGELAVANRLKQAIFNAIRTDSFTGHPLLLGVLNAGGGSELPPDERQSVDRVHRHEMRGPVRPSETGYVVNRNLTFLGVTMPVSFPATMAGGEVVKCRGACVINRHDFGMTDGMGKIHDNVEVRFDVNAAGLPNPW